MSGEPPADRNRDQIDFWSGAQGDKWVRLQKRIDALIEPFGRAVQRRLEVARGSHALDIGCGCGATSFDLADAVGPEGSVTGIDVSTPMVQRATARAATIPEINLRFVEADAQTAALPVERFDILFSRFGVMFFDDPVAAFANLRRATRPGGRLGFAAWRDRRDNPWATIPARALRAYVALPPTPPPNAPGQFGFADEGFVADVLDGAGWTDVAVERFDTEIVIGREPVDAADFLIEIGPAGPALAECDAETRRKAYDDLTAQLVPQARPGGVHMASSIWIVTASRP